MQNANFDYIIFAAPRSNYRAAIIISDDPNELETSTFSFPAVVITPSDGRQVIDYITRNPTPTATIAFQETILGLRTMPAPALAYFSSRDPALSYDGILKPDIMAPGVRILSAYSPESNVGEGPRIGDNIYLSPITLSCQGHQCPAPTYPSSPPFSRQRTLNGACCHPIHHDDYCWKLNFSHRVLLSKI